MPEQALRQLDVVRQKNPELLGRDRQADGAFDCLRRFPQRMAFQDLPEAEKHGRRQLFLLALLSGNPDPAVHQDLDVLDRRPFFLNRGTHFVPHLTGDRRDPEELIDVDEAKEGNPTKLIGQHHSGNGREQLKTARGLSSPSRCEASAKDAASKTTKSFASRKASTSSISSVETTFFAHERDRSRWQPRPDRHHR